MIRSRPEDCGAPRKINDTLVWADRSARRVHQTPTVSFSAADRVPAVTLAALAAAAGIALSGAAAPQSRSVDGGEPRPPLSSADDALGVFASEDGGPTYLGEPPGMTLTSDEERTTDSGAPDAATAQRAAGRREADLQQLRARIARLEQQLATARASAQIELLQNLNDQVAGLREQLAQEQALREFDSAAEQQALAQTQSAIDALYTAEQRLAFGDSDVAEALDSAFPALPFPAQLAVENARGSIQREDLAEARYWISVAVVETERSQLGH